MKGIIGRKVGMTQLFSKEGKVIPVTVVSVPSNVITQIKTVESDNYSAIQLGVEDKRENLANQPEMGHVKKANTSPKRMFKEIRLNNEEVANFEVGAELKVDMFEAGEFVDVQGTSKGKGFQGVIKRHNQATGPMSHGSRHHRRPGSMGAMATGVFKGKNLPGHMGSCTKTVQNLEIVFVDTENNALLIKGNVPGPKRSFVTIKSSVKNIAKKDKVDLVGLEKVAPVAAEETQEQASEE